MLNKTFPPGLFLVLTLCVFFILKIEYLTDPFFWDEIGVYGKGIIQMADGTPGLHPKSLPAHISRGHPLFYTFYHSCILKIIGNSHFYARLSNLVFSLSLPLLLFYFLSYKINTDTACMSILILLVQPIFFAQATMVLPEIMLSVLLLAGTFAFVQRKYILSCLFFCLAIMTKETALPVPLALATFEIFQCARLHQFINARKIILLRMTYVIPFGVFTIFICTQKIINGWYFFPFHTSLLTTDLNIVIDRILSYSEFIFLEQGRIWHTMICFLLIINICIQGQFDRIKEHSRLLVSIFVLSASLLSVYVITFHVNRYMMTAVYALLIFYALVWSITLQISSTKLLVKLLFFGSLLLSMYNMDSHSFNYDQDLSYRSILKLQKVAAKEMEEINLVNEKLVYTNFPLSYSFMDHRYGLVENEYKVGSLGQLGDETMMAYIIYPPGPGRSFPPEDREVHLVKILLQDFARLEVWEICPAITVKEE